VEPEEYTVPALVEALGAHFAEAEDRRRAYPPGD